MKSAALTVAMGLLLGAASGCVGNISTTGPRQTTGTAPGGGAGVPATSAGSAGAVTAPATFTSPSDDILILPFSVRLAKVAAVVGVPPSDPLLNTLRDNRLSLGDYDFANNVQPDKTWTALKVADWVRALKPICASPQMHARYPALPENVPALIEAAHGRAATAEDSAAITASAMGLATSPARYDTICLAILSSLEFVAQ